jgi:hypothetical protein
MLIVQEQRNRRGDGELSTKAGNLGGVKTRDRAIHLRNMKAHFAFPGPSQIETACWEFAVFDQSADKIASKPKSKKTSPRWVVGFSTGCQNGDQNSAFEI